MLQKFFYLFLAGSILFPSVTYAAERWYSADQVLKGEKLYANNCAACHKANAEGTENWRKTDSNGKYPPPPLNGTAHTWHHSMKVLSDTIRDGGIKLGGLMPGFKDKLDIQQRLDVIAFFQSKWDDKVYAAWNERNPLPTVKKSNEKSTKAKASSKNTAAGPRLEYLKKLAPGGVMSAPVETPVKGIYQVKIGGQYAYVTEDGQYAFVGNLLDLKNKNNLTEQAQARVNIPLLKAFPEKDVILFKAAGKEKAIINVFTDTSCPFCKKFHNEVPQLQKAGVSVRYLPFPRGMEKGPGYKEMLSVWCSKDRNKAMDIAMGVKPGKLEIGNCGAEKVLRSGVELGSVVGVQGTPTSYLPNGSSISGYVPAKRIIDSLSQK